jgi:hypothetical protein
MDEQKTNIEQWTSRIRKKAEKTRRACSWTLTSNLKEMKKKCFIGRRLISRKRESTINVFTFEVDEVLHWPRNQDDIKGKIFEFRGEELNDCSGTEKKAETLLLKKNAKNKKALYIWTEYTCFTLEG